MTGATFIPTKDIQAAVKGHEADVLAALGIGWRGGRGHVDCPYPDHGGKNDWRWDDKRAKAVCTCRKPHSIFDVVIGMEGGDFDSAKIRVAGVIGRADLIREAGDSGKRHQATDAESLLKPPAEVRDNSLPLSYLAHRLGVDETLLLAPNTPVAGFTALAYYDPPAKKNGKPVHVGDFPCAVFGTVAADGKRHAHRIYVAPDGRGKAALGPAENGAPRDPKKSAKVLGDDNTSGRSVLWGDTATASHTIVCEGIETGAAIAHALRDDVQAGKVVVAAAISATGLEAFKPWPATKRVTVAADRDEAMKGPRPGSRRGERAARAFGVAQHERVAVSIAMPGLPGESVDWLDILRREGDDAVRLGIADADPFRPTADELAEAAARTDRAAELAGIDATYPLPALETMRLRYQRTASGRVMVHKFLGTEEDQTTGMPREKWAPVSTPVGVPARLRMVDQGNAFGLRVMVQDMTGNPRPLDFNRAGLATMGASDVRAELFSAGLRVEGDGDAVAVAMLKAADPQEEIAVVTRPGWHTIADLADPVFITPAGEVIGAPDGLGAELSVNARLAPRLSRAGTLEGWQRAVEAAVRVQGCQHWTLGALAGFAGPLVGLTGLDTCGVNLSGMSSSGKSTSQRLATSAWSSPKLGCGGLFQSMRTTENAIELMCQTANGTVLALDELAHADGKSIGRMIYSISGGVGKGRMRADATMRARYSWSTFAVVSAEYSLEEAVRRAGGQWLAGMAVRIADIDVTGVNRAVDHATLATIGSVADNFGHAGPAFVQALIDHGMHQNPEALRDRINAAARKIAGDDADGARIRAATSFGLLVVAGELAKAFGILPAATPVGAAVQWAWARFQSSSDALALKPDDQAVEHLRRWIAERWNVSIRDVTAEGGNREAVAWYDDKAVYIPTNRIAEAAGGALKEQQIGKVLDERQLIERRQSAKRLAVKYIPRVGHVQAYALKRSEFGRSDSSDPEFYQHEEAA